MKKPYTIIALGGTFDHFHLGHQHFIEFANKLADKIYVGVTSDKLTKHKQYSDLIEPFKIRKRHVLKFCKQKGISAEISQLDDLFGPTLTDTKIKALCVTQETQMGAKKINEIRQSLKLRPLPVHICNWIKDENNEILNSTRIRAGKVNSSGQVYENIFANNLILNTNQKDFFSKLQGKLVNKPQIHKNIYIVGDTSLNIFLQNKYPFKSAIYDLKTNRQAHNLVNIINLKPNLKTKNPAGQITTDLIEKLNLALNKNFKYIYLDGEEDLATAALVLLLPLNSLVYYGQPEQGLVELKVTPEIKDKFLHILKT